MVNETSKQPTPKEVSMDNELRAVLLAVHKIFIGDADLVREGAHHHGVEVTTGNMIDAFSPGNYNARIPDGSPAEIEAIKQANTVAIICEDYRQSSEMAERTEADVIFANAGGTAQPKEARRKMMVEFVLAVHKINPTARFVFAFHLRRCGGGAYYTAQLGDKSIDEIIKHEGDEGERVAMEGYARQFIAELLEQGMPEELITLQEVALKPIHEKGQPNSIKEVRTIALR